MSQLATKLTIKNLLDQNKKAIRLAGPRYSPGQDAESPNIHIEYLDSTFDCLTQGRALRARVLEVRNQFTGDIRQVEVSTLRIFARRLSHDDLVDRLSVLAEAKAPSAVRAATLNVERALHSLLDASAKASAAIRSEESQLPIRGTDADSDKRRRTLNNRANQVAFLRQALYRVSDLTSGVDGRLLKETNAMLLLGGWGMGKTHLLCDLALTETRSKRPAMVVLATQLDPHRLILDAVAAASSLATDGERLLERLDEMGRTASCRALLIIDAINEGDREAWRQQLRSLLAMVARYQHVALVLSCRDPFQDLILSERSGGRLVRVWHRGFDEAEVDAQLAFFSFYDIEAPETPLLLTEFSRPLFLRLLCQSMSKLSNRSQKRKLREVAAGLKGLRHVIEHFARELGKPIEKDFNLRAKACWSIMKSAGERGISGLMAQDGRDWVRRQRVVALFEAQLALDSDDAERLLRRLVGDGLLIELVHWPDGDATDAISFSFQRFSDHLIANHLIPDSLSRLPETSIRRLFFANQLLGRIFSCRDGWREYDQPGLAAAIMLEWPERLRKTELPRELVSYLPKRARYVTPLATAFLDGLPWRDSESFTPATDRIISLLLERPTQREWEDTIEVLFGLATRPGHPCSAERLWRYLEDQTMVRRDLTWSDFVRTTDETSSVRRLVAWMELRSPARSPHPDLLRLLSLLLTTTDRALRDRATRQLVSQSQHDPCPLFDLTIESLTFNDPYVRERLLAASYGVLMQEWAGATTRLRDAAVSLARQLVTRMFMPSGDVGTKHALARGYAQGIIQLAQRISPGCIATQRLRYIRKPFPGTTSAFSHGRGISKFQVGDAMSSFRHSDFENYTMGRLVRDRGNYDVGHEEFGRVRRRIARRMVDLGYSSTAFEALDRRISETQRWRTQSWQSSQTDRYAKKYAWIAFFEMYGLRVDQGRLDPDDEARPSDCDIDPSFPIEADSWEGRSDGMFPPMMRGLVQWIEEGPVPDIEGILKRDSMPGISKTDWVLLHAQLGTDGSYDRRFWAQVRAVLVDPNDLETLRREVATRDAGWGRVPEPLSDYYTFAGEVPWSDRFGAAQRGSGGQSYPHLEMVYPRASDGVGVLVEIPTREWHWESHHSELNGSLSVMFPAPHLCDYLRLENRGWTFNLFTPDGSQVSVYAEAAAGELSKQSWLYVRAKQLDQYLAHRGLQLVWMWWGEREASYKKLGDRDIWPTSLGKALRSDAARFGGVLGRTTQSGCVEGIDPDE